jgi:hypothetical protein
VRTVAARWMRRRFARPALIVAGFDPCHDIFGSAGRHLRIVERITEARRAVVAAGEYESSDQERA